MFHALGAINSTAAAGVGAVLAVFKPVERPAFPTPEKVLAGLVATKAEVVFVLPVFLEAWSQLPEAIASLKKMRAVVSILFVWRGVLLICGSPRLDIFRRPIE